MYGSRGAMLGSGGVSDGYETSKRQRMIELNPYMAVTGPGSSDGYDMGSKRPRMMEKSLYFGMSGTGMLHQTYGGYGGGSRSMYNFPMVRVRGLPFDCDNLDIYQFFSGLDIVDCLLVNKNSRFSGEAVVVFESPLQAEFALQRDRHNMGRRYIEVFRGKKQDYYYAIAAEVSYRGSFDNDYRQHSPSVRLKKTSDDDQMEYTEILRLRGLPYSVTKSYIVEFFGEEYVLREDNVHIALRPDGKATGEAYMDFGSTEIAQKAMCKDKMMIGSRYVELFPSTLEEARRAESGSRQ